MNVVVDTLKSEVRSYTSRASEATSFSKHGETKLNHLFRTQI